MIDAPYIVQVAAVLLLLAGAFLALRYGFHRYQLSRYRARLPALDPASVLFCDRWDIGLSKDGNTLFLLRRKDHKAIRVRSVHGYRRHDSNHMERGTTGRFRETAVSEVILEYKGDQGKEEEPLTYGNSSAESRKLCRYLEQRGFRCLAIKTRFGYKN